MSIVLANAFIRERAVPSENSSVSVFSRREEDMVAIELAVIQNFPRVAGT